MSILETYEWDNIWWEQTGNHSAKRVLYVGDSISCGIRRPATDAANGRILFDGYGTSKAADHPYFTETLKLCLLQQEKRDAVLFNNGLHGFHLSVDAYAAHYRKLVRFLKETADAPLFLVLSTDCAESAEDQAVVEARNLAVKKIGEEERLPVLDLASEAKKYRHLHTADGIHFTEEGYAKLASYLVEEIQSLI